MYVHRLTESPNRSLHGMMRWHLKEYFLLQTIKQQVHGLRLPIRKHLSRRLSSVRANNLVIFLYFGSPFLLLPIVSWTCLLCLQRKKASKNVKGNKGKDSLANDKIKDNNTKQSYDSNKTKNETQHMQGMNQSENVSLSPLSFPVPLGW